MSCVFLPLHCFFRWPLCTQVLSVRGRTREKPEPELPLGSETADAAKALVQPARPPAPPPRPGGGKGNGGQASRAAPGLTVALCVCLAGRLYPVPQHRRGRSPLDPVSGARLGELMVTVVMVPLPSQGGESLGP